MAISPSTGVDDADDFSDGGDVVGHGGEALLEEGPHPLRHGHAPDLLHGGPPHDEPLDLGGDPQQLVDTDAVLVAGSAAEVAAFAGPELVLVGPALQSAGLHPERELLVGGRPGGLARPADPADEALADH